MKRFLSLILALVMAFALVTVGFAAPLTAYTRSEFLDYTGLRGAQGQDLGWFKDVYEYPEANIQLTRVADAAYGTDDLADTVATISAAPLYNIKADFDMDVVKDFFTANTGFSAGYFANYLGKTRGEIDTDFAGVPISGNIIVSITYPSNLNIPAGFLNANYTNPAENMMGFCDSAKIIFKETAQRTVSAVDADTNKLEITIGVKDDFNTYAELLEEARDTSQPNGFDSFTLTCENVQPTQYGSYPISGSVTGTFYVGDATSADTIISNIHYQAIQQGTPVENLTPVAKRTITILQPSVGPGGGGGGVVTTPVVNFYIYGDKYEDAKVIKNGNKVIVDLDKVIPPVREGMTFDGWYTDEAFTTKLTGEQTFTKDTNLYGKYVVTSAPSVFEDGYHKVYIHGYPDGTVQPFGMITREEVVTALYRLLKDEVKAQITTTENDFSDVESDRWSITEVSSMANAGYVNGYEDGSFRPGNAITRAEFAAIMLRFFADDDKANDVNPYSDITGHWAEDSIISAYVKNLFVGYPDGTFKPDAYITRAEAMTVINRITVRKPHKDGFVEGHIDWPDINESEWYYNDVIEATNSHDYIRIDDLMTEDWTELKN